MSCFEIAVGLGLALTGVFNPGPGGLNVAGFNPAHISYSSGFFLADRAVDLRVHRVRVGGGRRRGVPRPETAGAEGDLGSLILIGAFYVICAWGLQIGWGTDNLDRAGQLADRPGVRAGRPAVARRLASSS